MRVPRHGLVTLGLVAAMWGRVAAAQTLSVPATESAASAQPSTEEPPPAPFEDPAVVAQRERERERRFQEHVSQAVAAYKAGDLEKTTEGYLAAYAIEPKPLLLFNAAQAQRKAQKLERAIELYERFLQKAPKSPMAPEAQAHIQALRAESQAQRLAQEMATANQQAAQRSEEAQRLARQAVDTLQRENRELSQLVLQIKEEKPVYKKAWFWGVLGGGAAAIAATAVGLGVGLRKSEPQTTGGFSDVRF